MKTTSQQDAAFDALFEENNPFSHLSIRDVVSKSAAGCRLWNRYSPLIIIVTLVGFFACLHFNISFVWVLPLALLLFVIYYIHSRRYVLDASESSMIRLYYDTRHYYGKAMGMIPSEVLELNELSGKNTEYILTIIAISLAHSMSWGKTVQELREDIYENNRKILRLITEVVVRLGLAETKSIEGDDRVFGERANMFYRMVHRAVQQDVENIILLVEECLRNPKELG